MEHTVAEPSTGNPADGSPAESPADLLIAWDVAEQSAARLVPPGPRLSAREAAAEVAALRDAAHASVDHVHRITGLEAAAGLGAGSEAGNSDTFIVDRATWAKANAASFRRLLTPALEEAVAAKPEMVRPGSSTQVFGSAVAGTELGAVLGFLSANVLGQFDPFAPAGGRLMLVAPNVVMLRQELNLEPADFRLWVCLHEQTHRVQFAAAPWLPEHLLGLIGTLSSSTLGAADSLGDRLAEALRHLKEELQQRGEDQSGGSGAGDDGESSDGGSGDGGSRDAQAHGGASGPPRNRLIELIGSEEAREAYSQITAVMSLLEGHANHVMDAVDSSIVPSVKTIRRRFQDRGKHRSILERWVRRLLQLDVKARQYTDGQRFVSRVVETVGMERFNQVWESAEHLPTEEELHDPDRWVARMGFAETSAAETPAED
ncbi:zinc-dependent metalloprotease [Nesterenkonia sp. HG001]|uniref:zinc-dependent metalloprotease n=1 Tax=Nesterenkonia sp. HG001 TaxID=2983207 RepID=UPI002AC65740|nr:zinc-dependent metalloprotease [Nesterenkonia sp. HG001]MDZ5078220.1 zinc-dependent metalloprotease [Nesterenkonia sp. HG001]